MTWFEDRRQEWIHETLRIFGFINRAHIAAKFGVSIPQASYDLKQYQQRNPDAVAYDKSAKRYVRAGKQIRLKWTICPLYGWRAVARPPPRTHRSAWLQRSGGGAMPHAMKPSLCVKCGALLDRSAEALGDAMPVPGDITMCLQCGYWQMFSNELTLVDIPASVWVEIPPDQKQLMDAMKIALDEVEAILGPSSKPKEGTA